MGKNSQKRASKIYLLQDNMKSSQESLRDHNTPSMKEEKVRLSRLLAQVSMNSGKREHTDSQLEKDLKNEKVKIYQHLVNMSLNHILLKAHSTLFMKEEKRRLRPLLVQGSMKSQKKRDKVSQLVKNLRKENLKIYLHLVNMRSNQESLKAHNTLLEKNDFLRLSKLQAQENMSLLKKKDMESQLVKDTKSAHPKMYLLQDNMKSSQESLRDHNTPSMKEEKVRLSRLLAQVSMNSGKREHTDSQLEKDLKNELLNNFPVQANINI